jgi:alginate production protein
VLFLLLTSLAAGGLAQTRDPLAGAREGEEQAIEEAGGGPAGEDEDEEQGLRQRLTEREDKRRPLKPWSVEVGGRPLVIGGEVDVAAAYLRHLALGDRPAGSDLPFGEAGAEDDLLLVETALEVEAFYSFGPPLSLFFQLQAVWDEAPIGDPFGETSDVYVERGEMWLYSEGVAGLPLNFDIGRLHFEDDRRWWWDHELDGARLEWEAPTWDVSVAIARELGYGRTNQRRVETDQEGIFRVIGEASWDFAEEHGLGLFFLYSDDDSRSESPGAVVRRELEDDVDARLAWLGARVTGVFDLEARGFFGYWADAGLVRGKEHLFEWEAISRAESALESVSRRDVSGWGLDVGVAWLAPFAWEPRLIFGYAIGSGDANPGSGTDHSYRQTTLHTNEAGRGGVERFVAYGVLLDPELSNLQILNVGVGISLLRSSSLDLVYHYYLQVEAARSLRDARIGTELTGDHRGIGQEIDLVLAIEEWERLELEFIAAGFRAGPAFGTDEGRWSYGGFLAVRWAF